jgi:hypothetical protein
MSVRAELIEAQLQVAGMVAASLALALSRTTAFHHKYAV